MGIRFYDNINFQLGIKLMNCDETVIKKINCRRFKIDTIQCNTGIILKTLKIILKH